MARTTSFKCKTDQTLLSSDNHTLKLSYETNLLTMILNIVKREFAVTALLDLVTEYEKGIVGIPFQEKIYLDLALAWRREGYQSKADRAFIDFVKRFV